jgi:hypothetical protein
MSLRRCCRIEVISGDIKLQHKAVKLMLPGIFSEAEIVERKEASQTFLLHLYGPLVCREADR